MICQRCGGAGSISYHDGWEKSGEDIVDIIKCDECEGTGEVGLPDQSDKEMFDAQMISNLKDRVTELEAVCKQAMDWVEGHTFLGEDIDENWYTPMSRLVRVKVEEKPE